MRYLTRFTLAVMAALSLNACDSAKLPGVEKSDAPEQSVFQQGEVLATVNGKKLTRDLLDAYKKTWQSRRRGAKLPDDSTLLNELVNSELIYQDAIARSLDNTEEVKKQLFMQRRSVLIAAELSDYFKNNPVTDADRKALYESQIASQPNKEYKARHILVKEEQEAKDIIAKLDKGGDFVELAKKHSTGPSGKQGGELGWFPPNRMVPPFSAAVAAMDKGTYSKTPVKTQFGWHIILLEDERDQTPPAMEDVADQLNIALRNQRVQALFEELRGKASININLEMPGSAEPPAAEPEKPE